jgi:hypothetical protein
MRRRSSRLGQEEKWPRVEWGNVRRSSFCCCRNDSPSRTTCYDGPRASRGIRGAAMKTRSPTAPLFPDFEPGTSRRVRTYKRIEQPIWTENKAHVTSCCTSSKSPSTAFTSTVLPDRSRSITWMHGLPRSFYRVTLSGCGVFFLCEISPRGLRALQTLVQVQSDARDKKGRRVNRKIEVLPSDFNQNVNGILCSGKIAQKEATFCLLDQRTFEAI